MTECFKCGASGTNILFFDVVNRAGVVKLCEKCLKEEMLPVVRKPSSYDFKERDSKQSVYERLSKLAGLNSKEHKKNTFEEREKQRGNLRGQEITLKQIVERNLKLNTSPSQEQKGDLIPNFHWTIMRARRARKLTQDQLAKEINESPSVISSLEIGNIPDNCRQVINKLESFFSIRLWKDASMRTAPVKVDLSKGLKLDPLTTRHVTIGEIKKFKEEKEAQEPKFSSKFKLVEDADSSEFVEVDDEK
jgi:ribosome-binding protein aMBF1 (putative translation factor)